MIVKVVGFRRILFFLLSFHYLVCFASILSRLYHIVSPDPDLHHFRKPDPDPH